MGPQTVQNSGCTGAAVAAHLSESAAIPNSIPILAVHILQTSKHASHASSRSSKSMSLAPVCLVKALKPSWHRFSPSKTPEKSHPVPAKALSPPGTFPPEQHFPHPFAHARVRITSPTQTPVAKEWFIEGAVWRSVNSRPALEENMSRKDISASKVARYTSLLCFCGVFFWGCSCTKNRKGPTLEPLKRLPTFPIRTRPSALLLSNQNLLAARKTQKSCWCWRVADGSVFCLWKKSLKPPRVGGSDV